MIENNEIVCTWCGCKGKRVEHTRTMNQEKAKEYRWNDMRCGACGRAFKSYEVN